MAFICKDCGNKSTKKFPGGKCPACDSFNVKNTSSTQEAIREKEPKTLIELAMMAILWGGLAYGVWDRYIKAEPVTPPPVNVEKVVSKPIDDMQDY